MRTKLNDALNSIKRNLSSDFFTNAAFPEYKEYWELVVEMAQLGESVKCIPEDVLEEILWRLKK